MRLPYFALLCLLVADHDVDGSRLSKDTDTIDDASSRRKLSTMDDLLGSLDAASSTIDNKLFMYKTPSFQWVPSSVYRYDDFRAGLEVMAKDGVAGKKYYIGENVENGHIYGLVNIAAFLAQSMKETIQVSVKFLGFPSGSLAVLLSNAPLISTLPSLLFSMTRATRTRGTW